MPSGKHDALPSPTHLIVVGASAGGIEALSAFVAGLPTTIQAPIVIAQHLSRHRSSSLAAILQNRTSLPVETVESMAHLTAGKVFVVPSNRDVLINDHEVAVIESDHGDGKPSVDLLFRSAATAYGENLIAIVLSGTGSDGAAGAQEVKNAGGTVIIQNPETATFPGMPKALPSVIVDIIAEPMEIGAMLVDLVDESVERQQDEQDAEIRAFLVELRDRDGVDFLNYKQPTIRRRLQRRMTATGHRTLADYFTFARSDAAERQQLIKSFLINVTEFFRDPELYEYLQREIIPDLVATGVERGSELRIWSAGCSTGEEAYSLAIIVAEHLREAQIDLRVRIFATDLDEDAIAFARKGIYSARSLIHVPSDLTERYFQRTEGVLEVSKALRSMIVFGEHGLGQRAPFPRIDLVMCRNVLIYFTPALQRHALQLFAFSLRAGGYLVVGKSESVGTMSEFFSLDDSRFRVFRRLGNQAALPLGMKDVGSFNWVPAVNRMQRSSPASQPSSGMAGGHLAVRSRMRGKAEDVIQNLTAGVVVVNDRYDIQLINAMARRQFGIHAPAVGDDFLHLVTTVDVVELRRVIDRALRGEAQDPLLVQDRGLSGNDGRTLQVTAKLLPSQNDGDPQFVVLEAFDVTERERALRSAEAANALADKAIRSNEEILTANLELTSTIASLRAENEEFLVATEEIQAATEEMETLNEELHATNEELETLNEELQATAEELNTANDDLQARAVELQEMARVSEQRRHLLEATLFQAGRPVVVIDGDGTPIYRNESFRSTIEMSDGQLAIGSDGAEAIPLDRAVQQLAGLELPFETTMTLFRSQHSPVEFIARGQGDLLDGNEHAYIIVEFWPPNESLS
jgi:two-component system CheB/CheR fusion protein